MKICIHRHKFSTSWLLFLWFNCNVFCLLFTCIKIRWNEVSKYVLKCLLHRFRLTDTGVDENYKSTEMFKLGTNGTKGKHIFHLSRKFAIFTQFNIWYKIAIRHCKANQFIDKWQDITCLLFAYVIFNLKFLLVYILSKRIR